MGNAYQTNNSLAQGAHYQSFPTYGNNQGRSFPSPPPMVMQQQLLPVQQEQFMHNVPQLTPAQLARLKYEEEQPLREAVAYHRKKIMDERVEQWNASRKKKWWNPLPMSLKQWGIVEAHEREQDRKKAAKLEARKKEIEAQKAAIAWAEEKKAAKKEGREPKRQIVTRSALPVSPERQTEYDELFGDHNSQFNLNDVSNSLAQPLGPQIINGSSTAQSPARSSQDEIKRVVKRGREDDVEDDHIVKRPRLAAIESSSAPVAISTEVEPLPLSDPIDTPVVPQATFAKEKPRFALKLRFGGNLKEDHGVKRPRLEAVMSASPGASTERVSIASSSVANANVSAENLASIADVGVLFEGAATPPVNDEASSTKIDASNSDAVSVPQLSSPSAHPCSSSPGSTPPVPKLPDFVPATGVACEASLDSGSRYSSPVSSYSPDLSSDATPHSPVSPLSSIGSVTAMPTNKKRSRQSDDEGDEAPPLKRQFIRAKSLKSPTGLAAVITDTTTPLVKVLDVKAIDHSGADAPSPQLLGLKEHPQHNSPDIEIPQAMSQVQHDYTALDNLQTSHPSPVFNAPLGPATNELDEEEEL
ncbi:hypothetical protein FKW77_004752 [Venturia effusa]|uniref:Uncharacterized protein n=1 Tax=Venturia effusa TaxID=50376 RepID=A0A517LLE8_9PEZI|nr:hypothetical protein FKW77_004752 [Venturia effusa]